ncbi:flagellar protein FlaG [Clostridium sp. AL.422]|uniref:flagellar protein FlaG n=1 Tax=Clostridium TaxID=1485 RepID=UPI00293DBDEB|nr:MULTISPECIES: flagellar protein FlaG [unclassified Clostridium]MDV4149722.1 flagellar protein FlaG [Clostridium sp. AL.422]
MDLKVISQGGQANLNTSLVNDLRKVSDNRDVEETVTTKDKKYTEEKIAEAVDKLNKLLKDENAYAEYSVHEKFGDIMIKIIDSKTKEIIVEYPPKKILDLIARMCELSGIAIDKKA